jgi:hypothetical protein
MEGFDLNDSIILNCDDGLKRYGVICVVSTEKNKEWGYRICIDDLQGNFCCGYSLFAKKSRVILLEKKITF